MKVGLPMLSISPPKPRGRQRVSRRSAGTSALKDYFQEVELYGR
jgi:hypothetical protein